LNRAATMRLVRATAAELEAAMGRMRIPGHPRPYYLSYLIRDEERWRIQAKYGALKVDRYNRSRNAYVDVRVGSYRSDHIRDGGLEDNDKEAESYSYVELPYSGRIDGYLHQMRHQVFGAGHDEDIFLLVSRESFFSFTGNAG
jgi:TldD protein